MGILFKGADNSTSLMDHCIVEYAGANNHNSCDPRVYNNDQHGGISCIGAGSNITIQNSVIRNNRCFGIFLYSSPAVITGNTIFENGEGGVCTYISSAIILNNIISNNGVYGIRAIYSHATIAHNTIDDNGTYGVLIEELGNSFNRIPVGLVFTYNTLSRNGQYDLYTLCTGDIDLSGDVFNTGIYAPNCTITTDRIPPEEVRNLRVASGQTSLAFIWDPSLNVAGDLAGYRVYFDEDTQGVQVGPDQTSHEVTGLSPSSAYPCRITAYDTSGNESDGVQVIGYTLLSNPTNVMVTPYHEYAVLNWQAVEPSANVGYYRVYVSEMSFGSVEGMSPRAYSYTTSAQINNLQNGITYYFAVTAVNRSGGELKSVNTITATPLVDTSGPIINNLKLNGSVFNIGGTMTHSGTFTVSASDPSKVSRVEYYLDGVLAGTSYNSPFRFYLNIENLADGSHTLRVVAYDTFGNSTAMDHDFVILLAPPSAPVIKKPSSGLVTNNTEIAVSGTADKNTSVTVYLGGVSAGDPVAVGEGGTFSVRVTLNQGENHIRAAARNNAGEGPLSPVVVVTVDGSVPDAPQSLIAQAASGGAVKLSWYRPLNSAVTGYNIYRSSSSFAEKSQALKVNFLPVNTTSYHDLPSVQGTYYYRAACVNAVEVESALSNEASVTSDSVLPRAISVQYNPHGAYDEATGRFAPGIVDVTVNVSEKLEAAPFLSITPSDGVPILISLSRNSDLVYTGIFTISEHTPSGEAFAVFSAKDMAGNRGTEIDAGSSIIIDTEAPSVSRIELLPGTIIKNDQQNPVEVTVTIGLNDHVKEGAVPSLTYLLSQEGRVSVPVGTLVEIPAEGSDIETWQGTFTLPADAGLAQAEAIRFTCVCTDDLDNVTSRLVPGNFQVYQGDLPPLDAPAELTARPLPEGDIELKWSEVKGAVAYQLYRKAPGEQELTGHLRVNTGLEVIDSPYIDGTYTYAVASIHQANGQESKSGMSNTVVVASDSTPPGIPRNLSLLLNSDGIHAGWEAPAIIEDLTYELYRSSGTYIPSISGLTPILTGIETTSAIDPTPSPDDHCYVVVAVDAAGNRSLPSDSAYLNFALLPVSSLKVVRNEDDAPVITWTHPGGNVVGYNLYIGPEANRIKINNEPMAQLIYTDTGYTGVERVYTVMAEDANNVQSLGRSITLSDISAVMSESSSVRRGIMNRVEYVVENLSAAEVKNARLHALIMGRDHVSESFAIGAGQSVTVPVIVGGYADLMDIENLATTIAITPKEGELVEIVHSESIQVGDAVMVVQLFNEEFTRGGAGKVTFSFQNTSEGEIEIVTAEKNGGSPSSELIFHLVDDDGNVLSTASYKQVFGAGAVTLTSGVTVVRVPAGFTFISDPVDIDVPSSASDELEVRFTIENIYYRKDKPEQVRMDGPVSFRAITLVDTSYYGRIESITPENSSGDEDIVVTGQAIQRATSTPMARVPLRLVIEVGGFERKIDIFTDESGSFSYTFTPLDGESGEYHVYAVHPDILDNPIQAMFFISRLTIKPGEANLSLARNHEKTVEVRVSTGPVTAVSNLRLEYVAADQQGGVLPQGIHVVTGGAIALLESLRAAVLGAFVWADNTAGQTSTVVLRVL
ncbi:MAG: fibronectin type III domain-containing protein, partial [Desulfomonilia bacterium]|nr:fibronectin type III domain-containing protein [Desulfomonilia bacterium]